MKESRLTMPEVAAIAGTRVALGSGLALLLADRIELKQRRAIGWTLFLVGAISTVPLVMRVLDKRR
ncbi:MAG: hypothetical protein HXX11_13755 [Desulfuromonadales bacterium]|nr:hypothetical protein [Desulfuromonadales bacterium]